MGGIFHFFSAIFYFMDNSPEILGKFFSKYIKTGKIFVLLSSLIQSFFEKFFKILEKIYKSQFVQALFAFFLRLPLVQKIVPFFSEGFALLGHFYKQVLAIFLFCGIPTILGLVFLFEHSLSLFFIGFLSFFLLHTLIIFTFYTYVVKRESGASVSFLATFLSLVPRLFSLISVALFSIFVFAFFAAIFLFILSVSNSWVFSFHLSWVQLFSYWSIILLSGIFLFFLIFLFTMVSFQVYYLVLFADLSPFAAFLTAKAVVDQRFWSFFSLYFFVFFCFLPLLFVGILFTSSLDVALFLLLFYYLFFYLGFFLWRHVTKDMFASMVKPTLRFSRVVSLLVFVLGTFSYIGMASLSIRFFPQVLQFFNQQAATEALQNDLTTYEDVAGYYTISYPKSWTIYHWQDNSVTFFNNYTGTFVGSAWVTVHQLPLGQSGYQELFDHAPGVVSEDPDTKNLLTKISNISFSGFPGVSYTYIQNDLALPEYQTHFLINRNGTAYDISFVTLNQRVADADSDLFTAIIQSFRFSHI